MSITDTIEWDKQSVIVTLETVIDRIKADAERLEDVIENVKNDAYCSEFLEQIIFDVLNNSDKTGHLRHALIVARRLDEHREEVTREAQEAIERLTGPTR